MRSEMVWLITSRINIDSRNARYCDLKKTATAGYRVVHQDCQYRDDAYGYRMNCERRDRWKQQSLNRLIDDDDCQRAWHRKPARDAIAFIARSAAARSQKTISYARNGFNQRRTQLLP